MTAIKLAIMVRAAKIRVATGEKLEDVLNSWTALTAEERLAIANKVAL